MNGKFTFPKGFTLTKEDWKDFHSTLVAFHNRVMERKENPKRICATIECPWNSSNDRQMFQGEGRCTLKTCKQFDV